MRFDRVSSRGQAAILSRYKQPDAVKGDTDETLQRTE
jgi:hypothetical protein